MERTTNVMVFQRMCVALAIVIMIALLRGDSTVSKKEAGFNQQEKPGSTPQQQPHEFHLAFKESAGFFDDIEEREWVRLQQRHVDQFPNHSPSLLKESAVPVPANNWYQNHFEPEFSCRHERRVGRKGDGGKWVCDPYRIADSSKGCLVYSIGSSGDASFEKSVKSEISEACEIHTFDINKSHVRPSGQVVDYAAELKLLATFHNYGIGTAQQAKASPTKYKTLKQIMKELGHEGRTVDIFKVRSEKLNSVLKDL
jgi:hypothetical protein